MGKQVMGIEVCTCDEDQVMDESAESLYCTSKTNITLYAYVGIKIFSKTTNKQKTW